MHSSTSFEAVAAGSGRHQGTTTLRTAALIAGLLAASCGGSGSGATIPLDAPSALAYPTMQFDLLRDVQVPPLVPAYVGGSASFTITPALPTGLYLNAHTGAVTGIPQSAMPRTMFAVRAHNSGGSVSATFELEIHSDFDQPKFVYALHSQTNEISTWRYDAGTNSLIPTGRVQTGSGPIRAEVDPLGRFLYVALAGQEHIAVHRIDAATGRLEPVQLALADGATFDLAFDPSGRFLYKSNLQVNTVQSYRIDPSNGILIPVGASVIVPGPSGLTVSRDGRDLFAGSIDGGAVLHFGVDEATGAIEQLLGAVGAGSPVDLLHDADTGRLYVADFLGNRILTYLVSNESGRPTLLYSTSTEAGPASLALNGGELEVACHGASVVQRFTLDGPGGEPQAQGTEALAGRPTKLQLLAPGHDALVALDDTAMIAQVERAEDGELIWTDHRTCAAAVTDVVVVRGPKAFELTTEGLFAATAQSLELTAYRALAGELETAGLPVSVGLDPEAIVVDSTGDRLFVVERGSDQITSFAIDRATLELSRGPSTPAGYEPRDAVLLPGADHLVSVSADGISLWEIAENGALEQVAFDATGALPRHVVVDPSGRFAYVSAGNDVLTYAVDARAGTLTHQALGGLSFAGGSEPSGLAIAPNGTTLVVALEGSRRMHVAALDPVTGVLTSASTLNMGLRSLDPTFDATGERLFTVEPEDGLMSLYSIGAGRTLALLSRADCGQNSNSVALDRRGDRAYGAAQGSDSIEVLSLDAGATTLQPEATLEVGVGSGPQAVATFAGWHTLP